MADSKSFLSERKLRKLRRNPWLFFRDAARNRINATSELVIRTASHLPVGGFVSCQRRYTAIAAVYNVEKYLDRFFESMAQQVVSFDEHIELIIVDDGSTDGSAAIIEKWRKKHPKSIRYIYKENGGQASARNVGLGHASGEWITFIDPDDFVHPRYFERVDRFLSEREEQGEKLGILCCKWVFYHEDQHRFVDNHPLDYRFANGSYSTPADPNSDVMVSSAARSFFRADILARERIYFDESLRPNFEDGHFTGMYLLRMGELRVGFVADAIYYYRKRSDGTSTLDTGWEKPSRFGTVVERGYLALLRDALETKGVVPRSLQKLVLYDLIWLFKKIVGNESSVAFLRPPQKAQFKKLLFEVFELIDASTIADFNLAGAWLFHKVGLLGMYKSKPPPFQIAYVGSYDETKRLLEISYFYHGEPVAERFCVSGQDRVPRFAKVRVHDFLGDVFVYERRVWLELDEGYSTLSIEIDGQGARISLGKTQQDCITRSMIERTFRSSNAPPHLDVRARALRAMAESRSVRRRFKDAWLLIDRDRQADDNAEHLYRYILREHPEINAFFVLHESSHDWARLSEEGFRLVAFGSRDHHLLLLRAKHVVSSHADSFVLGVLPERSYGDLLNFKFTFLQHGVIRDDISNWLNTKKIDLFVTSSPAEHESVAGDVSRYKFGRHQTKRVGLARHDVLLSRTQPTEKVVLIMPTWRQWLVSGAAHGTGVRSPKSSFYESTYAQRWRSVLHSEALRELTVRHGYRVVFFPHANMQMYADWFDAPSWIDVRTHANEPILQLLYRRAAMMITDYSSVFFEMGLLDKPVVYYQFDYDEMYGGAHPSRAGYFDFQRDGFGPVVSTEDALVREVEALLARECQPAPEYLRRMQATLPLRDGRNRERTVQAIMALDSPQIENDQREEIALAEALAASRRGLWDLAERRWTEILANAESHDERAVFLANAKRKLGKLDEAQEVLGRLRAKGAEIALRVEIERAEMDAARGELARSIERWTALRERGLDAVGIEDDSVALTIARLERKRGEPGNALRVLESLAPSQARDIELAELAMERREWGEAAVRFAELARAYPADDHLLRVAHAYRELGNFGAALRVVATYVERGGRAPVAKVLHAQLLAQLGEKDAARKALLGLTATPRKDWPESAIISLALACADLDLFAAADEVLDTEPTAIADMQLQDARLAVLETSARWRAIVEMRSEWMSQLPREQRLTRELVVVRAHHALGDYDRALALLDRMSIEHARPFEVLSARAESLSSAGRWDDALHAWRELQREHPDRDPQRTRARIAFALERLGRSDEASSVLVQAAWANALDRLQRDPSDPEIYRQLVVLVGERAKSGTDADASFDAARSTVISRVRKQGS
jgi:glycosyltransferase involved in cell wall biosynthesis/CDP-glycerol glycerophosphotransferase (TagB/SpsB family)